MKQLFEELRKDLKSDGAVMLVTVLVATGSTPRSAGARMIVRKDGSIFSTIGGGAAEHYVRNLAVKALGEKKSFCKALNMAELGMTCGGDIEVHFQYISGDHPKIFSWIEELLSCYEKNEDFWLVSELSEKSEPIWGIFSSETTVDEENIPTSELRPYFLNKPRYEFVNGKGYYIDPFVQAGRVYVFGGGHVAQELVPLLNRVDFRCVVFEDREAFLTEALFPNAEERILGDTRRIKEKVSIGKKDYVVIMTRGHEHDYSVVAQALGTEAAYIGMIGSRNKIAVTSKRLIEDDGYTEEDIKRVHMPIGLKIHAETPAEIAVSIAGEMIEARAALRNRL